jgi:hypothetical protein
MLPNAARGGFPEVWRNAVRGVFSEVLPNAIEGRDTDIEGRDTDIEGALCIEMLMALAGLMETTHTLSAMEPVRARVRMRNMVCLQMDFGGAA